MKDVYYTDEYLKMMMLADAHNKNNRYIRSYYQSDYQYLMEYGHCSLNIGRQTGKTEAALLFACANPNTLIVVPKVSMIRDMEKRFIGKKFNIVSVGQIEHYMRGRQLQGLGLDDTSNMVIRDVEYIIFDDSSWCLDKIIQENRLEDLTNACINLRMVYSLGCR